MSLLIFYCLFQKFQKVYQNQFLYSSCIIFLHILKLSVLFSIKVVFITTSVLIYNMPSLNNFRTSNLKNWNKWSEQMAVYCCKLGPHCCNVCGILFKCKRIPHNERCFNCRTHPVQRSRCLSCLGLFPSRNKLFMHLRQHPAHAIDLPPKCPRCWWRFVGREKCVINYHVVRCYSHDDEVFAQLLGGVEGMKL